MLRLATRVVTGIVLCLSIGLGTAMRQPPAAAHAGGSAITVKGQPVCLGLPPTIICNSVTLSIPGQYFQTQNISFQHPSFTFYNVPRDQQAQLLVTDSYFGTRSCGSYSFKTSPWLWSSTVDVHVIFMHCR